MPLPYYRDDQDGTGQIRTSWVFEKLACEPNGVSKWSTNAAGEFSDLLLATSASLKINAGAGTTGQFLRGGSAALAWSNTLIQTALATTSTDGLVLHNTTPATSGVTVQISPRLRLRGNAWDTSATETVDFFIENLPATAATPTGTFKVGYSLNGAAASYPLTLTSAGILTTASSMLAGGAGFQTTATGGSFYVQSRSGWASSADGKAEWTNFAGNAGIGLDFSTDSTLKIRNRAQNAYGTVDALGYKVSGVAGVAAFGPAGVASITVVNGLITAIS